MTRFQLLLAFLLCNLVASAQLDPSFYGDYWDADDSFSMMISAPEEKGGDFSFIKSDNGGTLLLAMSMDEPVSDYAAPPAVGNTYKNEAGILIFVPESSGNYVITFPAGMNCPDIPVQEFTFYHEEGIYKGVSTAFISTPAVERNLIFKRTGETMKVYFSPGEKNLAGICPKFLGDYKLVK